MSNGFTPAPGHIKELIVAAAEKHGVSAEILERIGWTESRWREDIITGKTKSPVGAVGLMQFMPATAADLGINPLDIKQAVDGAARYFKSLMHRFDGDEAKAVAAYNWGMGNVSRKGLENAPKETRDYLVSVLGEDYMSRPLVAGQQAPADPAAVVRMERDAAAGDAGRLIDSAAAAGVAASGPAVGITEAAAAASAEATYRSVDETNYGVSTGEYMGRGLGETYTVRAWELATAPAADPNFVITPEMKAKTGYLADAEINRLYNSRSQEEWDYNLKKLEEDREFSLRGKYDSPMRAFLASTAGSVVDPVGMALGLGVGWGLSTVAKTATRVARLGEAVQTAKAAQSAVRAPIGVSFAKDIAGGMVFDGAAETAFQAMEGVEVDYYSVLGEVVGGVGFASIGAGIHVARNSGQYLQLAKEWLAPDPQAQLAMSTPRVNAAAAGVGKAGLDEDLFASILASAKELPDATPSIQLAAAMGTVDGTTVSDTPILSDGRDTSVGGLLKMETAEKVSGEAPAGKVRSQWYWLRRWAGSIKTAAGLSSATSGGLATVNVTDMLAEVAGAHREEAVISVLNADIESDAPTNEHAQAAMDGKPVNVIAVRTEDLIRTILDTGKAGIATEEATRTQNLVDYMDPERESTMLAALAKGAGLHEAIKVELAALLERFAGTDATVLVPTGPGLERYRARVSTVLPGVAMIGGPEVGAEVASGRRTPRNAGELVQAMLEAGTGVQTLVHELKHVVMLQFTHAYRAEYTGPSVSKSMRALHEARRARKAASTIEGLEAQLNLALEQSGLNMDQAEALWLIEQQYDAAKVAVQMLREDLVGTAMAADGGRRLDLAERASVTLSDLLGLEYALKDMDEFVSQTANSPTLVGLLSSMPSKRGLRDALSDFVRAVLKALGLSTESTAYTDVMYAYESFLRTRLEGQQFGNGTRVVFAPKVAGSPPAPAWPWPKNPEQSAEGRLKAGLPVNIFQEEGGETAGRLGLKQGDTAAELNRHTANALKFFKDWVDNVESNPLWQRAQERFRQWRKATGKELAFDGKYTKNWFGGAKRYLDSISQMGAESKVPGVRAMIGVLADSANGANRFGATVSSYYTKAHDTLVYGTMPKMNAIITEYIREQGGSIIARAFHGGDVERQFWREVEVFRQERRKVARAGGGPTRQHPNTWVQQAADLMDEHAARAVDLLVQSGIDHGLNIQEGSTVGYHRYEFSSDAIAALRREDPERIKALAENLRTQFMEQFIAGSAIPEMLKDPRKVVQGLIDAARERAQVLTEKFQALIEQVPGLQEAIAAEQSAKEALLTANDALRGLYARARELDSQAGERREADEAGGSAEDAVDTLFRLREAHAEASDALKAHKEAHPGRVSGVELKARKGLKANLTAAYDALQEFKGQLADRNELLADEAQKVFAEVDRLRDEKDPLLAAYRLAAARKIGMEALLPPEMQSPYMVLRAQIGGALARAANLDADPAGYVQARVQTLTALIEQKAASRAQHYLDQVSVAGRERKPELGAFAAQLAQELLHERFAERTVDAPLAEAFGKALENTLNDRSRREFDITSSIGGVRLMDFMDIDGRRMLLGLTRDAAGQHALAKFGIRDEFQKRGIMQALRQDGASVEEREAVQTLLDFYSGTLDSNHSDLSSGLRNLAYSMMMTKNALNMIADAGNVGHVAGMRGVLETFTGIIASLVNPKTWQRKQATERLTGVAKELAAALPGRVGDEFMAWTNIQESSAGEYVSDGTLSRGIRSLAHAQSHLFGAQIAARITQETMFRVLSNTISEIALGMQERTPERLFDMGLTEQGFALVQKEAKKHAEVVNGEIKSLGLEHWEVDARDLMLAAVQRAQAAATSRSLAGEAPGPLLTSDSAAFFYQFRQAGLLAAEKHAARSWIVGDAGAGVAVFMGTIYASLMFAAKTGLAAAAMSDKEAEEYRRKRFTPETPAEMFEAGIAWATLYNPGGNLADVLQIGGVVTGPVRPQQLLGSPGLDAAGMIFGVPQNLGKAALADNPEDRNRYLGSALRALPGLNAPLPGMAISTVLDE